MVGKNERVTCPSVREGTNASIGPHDTGDNKDVSIFLDFRVEAQ